MRVAAHSDVKKLAASVAASLADSEEGCVLLSCMGAAAVNQAIKAAAFLQRFNNSPISVIPFFESDAEHAVTRIILEIHSNKNRTNG